MDRIDWTALLLAAGIISFQIFVPPVVGLADNGDFAKIIGRFDLYLPQGQSTGFADTTYTIDPVGHHYVSDHVSPEIVLAGIAVQLDRIFFSSTIFDLRWIGAVHAALYLAAFYLALPLLRRLPLFRRVLLMAVIIFILADVMYVSALNSFYMDTTAWIFICLNSVLFLRALRWPTSANRIALIFALVALITAKTQHIVAGCVLCALVIVTRRRLGLERLWLSWSTVAVIAALEFAFLGIPRDYSSGSVFSVVFYELLPHSDNVSRDLTELGLDQSFRRWVGMHAYSDGAPMVDRSFTGDFRRRTGFGLLASYYARHPRQTWRILIANLGTAGRQRAYLGNYDRRTGARELQESNAFAGWSNFKKVLFEHHGKSYFGYVLGVLTLVVTLAWMYRGDDRGAVFAGAIGFAVLTILEMLTCSLADAIEVLRHEFVFNGLTDLAVVFLAALVCARQTRAYQAVVKPAPFTVAAL